MNITVKNIEAIDREIYDVTKSKVGYYWEYDADLPISENPSPVLEVFQKDDEDLNLKMVAIDLGINALNIKDVAVFAEDLGCCHRIGVCFTPDRINSEQLESLVKLLSVFGSANYIY